MDGSWSRLRNGWGFDGVLNLQDGQPFQLNYNFEGDYSGSGEGFDRPDVVGPVRYGSGPFSVDLSSFQVPCTFGNTTGFGEGGDSDCLAGSRHFGDLGRNSLRAPAFKELNFSISKNTPITERVILQIRAEFFNLLQSSQFRESESAELHYRPGQQWTRRGGSRDWLPAPHRNRRRRHRQPVPGRRRARAEYSSRPRSHSRVP